MSDIVDDLAAVVPHDRVAVELADGTTVEGRAAPVTFDPNERLRIELRPEAGDERYELAATVEGGEWTPVRVRRQSGDGGWESLGDADAATRVDDEPPEADGGAS